MADEPEEQAMRARLDALSESLRARRPPPVAPKPAPAGGGEDGFGSAMSMAMRAGSEFVAGVLGGGAIGFGLDWLFGTKPALTIVFFFLGVAAGTLNVIRAASPKGGRAGANSRLYGAKARDKDVPRTGPGGAKTTRTKRRGGTGHQSDRAILPVARGLDLGRRP